MALDESDLHDPGENGKDSRYVDGVNGALSICFGILLQLGMIAFAVCGTVFRANDYVILLFAGMAVCAVVSLLLLGDFGHFFERYKRIDDVTACSDRQATEMGVQGAVSIFFGILSELAAGAMLICGTLWYTAELSPLLFIGGVCLAALACSLAALFGRYLARYEELKKSEDE